MQAGSGHPFGDIAPATFRWGFVLHDLECDEALESKQMQMEASPQKQPYSSGGAQAVGESCANGKTLLLPDSSLYTVHCTHST